MISIKNEKGYLLLEILLSITLLSIVLSVFFGYFIQSKNHVNQTESISAATQLSQEILIKVRDSNFQTNLTLDNFKSLYGSDFTGAISINNRNYYPEVYIQHADLAMKQENTSIPTHYLDKLDYIQVVIMGDRNGARVKLYETYGYKVRDSN